MRNNIEILGHTRQLNFPSVVAPANATKSKLRKVKLHQNHSLTSYLKTHFNNCPAN